MTDLTEKAIQRLARETGFRLELMLIRADARDGTAPKGTLDQRVRRLARLYGFPPWFIRAQLAEEDSGVDVQDM